jgi:peptidoglycan/xylan/chitin deacetylase (PgdA/CDA1 family)
MPGEAERPHTALRRLLAWACTHSSAILAYHGIASVNPRGDPRRLMLPPEVFMGQVRALQEAGFQFLTVSELARRIVRGSPPAGLVALTFDDGLHNLFEPLLGMAAAGHRSSVYPVSGWIGGQHPAVPDPMEGRMLDRDQLRTLANAGVEIGAHTATHADLSRLVRSECLHELRQSRKTLESIVERPVETVAYPYGRHSPTARNAAREAGFKFGLAEERGLGWDALAMARAPVWPGGSWSAFALKASGRWPQIAGGWPGNFALSMARCVRRTLPTKEQN